MTDRPNKAQNKVLKFYYIKPGKVRFPLRLISIIKRDRNLHLESQNSFWEIQLWTFHLTKQGHKRIGYEFFGQSTIKLITRCLAIGTPSNNLHGNLATSIQFPCSATTGETKHYTAPTEIKGMSM